jgi:N-acetylglucosaminyl-diphospho-decaprenol L-rhamnosyltransferase
VTSSVHIVIVNWNTGPYLKACLDSIAATARAGFELTRVTVVDNASTDGSERAAEVETLPLELMRNPQNVGFAAACNQGARGSIADYLLFLNPDTELSRGSLAAVVRFMDGADASEVGICGAGIVDREEQQTIAASRFPTLRIIVGKMTGLDRLFPRVFPRHHLTASETRDNRIVDQVIGAFFFVRRSLFEQLAGFDPRYFLYFEEVDFSLRARAQGFRSYFLKDATVFHAENVSSKQLGSDRLYHLIRSRYLYARLHWKPWQSRMLLVMTFTIEPVARFVSALMHRQWTQMRELSAAYRKAIGEVRNLSG